MVWAQAVDAVEVLRYNGRASGKGSGQVLRQLKYFQFVVRLRSCSQAIEENYLSPVRHLPADAGTCRQR